MTDDNVIPFPVDRPPKRLAIDLDDVELAMDSGGMSEVSWYLDTDTGEVIFIQEFSGDEDMEELRDRVLSDEVDRYLEVPTTDSGEAFEDMEDWAESLQNVRLQDRLLSALSGSRPFRRFKDVLLDWPAEREAWFAFKRDRDRQRALQWLEAEGIDAVPMSGLGSVEGAPDQS